MTKKQGEPGSVSHGTMNPDDLIPRFMNALKELDQEAFDRIEADWPAFFGGEEDAADGEREENEHYVLDDIFDALNDCAPDEHYFGAHPGDGSDYGFWPCDML